MGCFGLSVKQRTVSPIQQAPPSPLLFGSRQRFPRLLHPSSNHREQPPPLLSFTTSSTHHWHNITHRLFFLIPPTPPYLHLYSCRNLRLQSLHILHPSFWTPAPLLASTPLRRTHLSQHLEPILRPIQRRAQRRIYPRGCEICLHPRRQVSWPPSQLLNSEDCMRLEQLGPLPSL